MRRLFVFATVLLSVFLSVRHEARAADRPNVLFIAIDDLNDWVGSLGGNPQAKTPHLDKLAARGVNFQRAYCASPVCNPSRAALMSGMRSSTTGVYQNGIDWRTRIPADKTATLNMHFLANGYDVRAMGKIYHGSYPRVTPQDWTEYPSEKGLKGESKIIGTSRGVGGIAFAPTSAEDNEMPDYQSVDYAIEQLGKPHDKPFFLACGLHKPHMPWNVPKKYYDMFPLESIILPEVIENDLADIPVAGVKMAKPDGDHKAMLESGRWKEAVQGYLAAGAFCDAMIGRLMEAFDKSAYKDNTIIVLWGDHGWHLGEKEHWRKFALWEEATRAPFMWVVPGVTRPNGNCYRTVDFMSIYPTLCDLCNLPKPDYLEGVSIVPLLKNPEAAWSTPALTTHGFQNHGVRSEQWRYIRYADGSEELYDEKADPMEWTNLAGKPEHAAVKAELAKWLPKVNVPEGASTENAAPRKAKKATKKAATE
jgi:arylsulfatase A-like enzyme